jgi:hypothetical protein
LPEGQIFGEVDLRYYQKGKIVAQRYAGVLPLGDTAADYNSCRAAGGGFVSQRALDLDPPGSYYCVRTSEKRYAALKLLSFDDDWAVFDVVVYDPPDVGSR